MGSPGFGELASRLVRYVQELIRRGEMSERRLARLTGYSQPHIHNVLRGVRSLNLAMADRFLETLGVPLAALFTPDELAGRAPPSPAEAVMVPVLSGRLGGGQAFPQDSPQPRLYPMPAREVQDLQNPALATVDREERSMWPALWPGDLALLDRGTATRRRPRLDSVYALAWEGRGLIGRCQRIGSALALYFDNEAEAPDTPDRLPVGAAGIYNVVRGRIVWIGRDLREEEL